MTWPKEKSLHEQSTQVREEKLLEDLTMAELFEGLHNLVRRDMPNMIEEIISDHFMIDKRIISDKSINHDEERTDYKLPDRSVIRFDEYNEASWIQESKEEE